MKYKYYIFSGGKPGRYLLGKSEIELILGNTYNDCEAETLDIKDIYLQDYMTPERFPTVNDAYFMVIPIYKIDAENDKDAFLYWKLKYKA